MNTISRRYLSTLKKIAPVNRFNSKGAASTFKPGVVAPGVFHQPAPSIPSPLQKTPNAFLPQEDPRKVAQSDVLSENLKHMPPLSEIREKSYHLTSKDVDEIRRLRNEDPYKYTRKALAEQFKCSPFFIGVVAQCPEARVQDMKNRLEQIKSQWRPKRRQARLDKEKRKERWYQDL